MLYSIINHSYKFPIFYHDQFKILRYWIMGKTKDNVFLLLDNHYQDRAERHDFWSGFLLFILLFFFPLKEEEKGDEGKRNNQSRGQNSFLSARSIIKIFNFVLIL